MLLAALAVAAPLALAACGDGDRAVTPTAADRPTIAVTTPVLGAIVRDAVGEKAVVDVVMPNGADPHEWRPSGKDVARLQGADLVVENGLDLEEGLTSAIRQARDSGVPVFTATDHVDVRKVADGDVASGRDAKDDDHADGDHGEEEHGAEDPHFWTDPVQARRVVLALPAVVKKATGADISAPAASEAASLASLDRRLAEEAATIPVAQRTIVTGHESLGYLARRYGYTVIGAITPSLSSQGQVSAAHLAALEEAIDATGTRVVFAETGTPDAVAKAVADETGAALVELPSHSLPADGEYGTYISELVRTITSSLAARSAE